jgi:hypothetical protein
MLVARKIIVSNGPAIDGEAVFTPENIQAGTSHQ